ncbi:MAG: DUF2771 family protein [Pseudonocardiaceae bacterium]
MPRGALLPAVLATSVLVGCVSAPDRDVTFSIEGPSSIEEHSVTTGPIRYCDVELVECENNDSAIAVLAVPADQPIHISVPDSVAQTPWQVVFRYRKNGEQVGGRSAVFTPGTRHDYTLQAPDSGTLEALEVQQYGAPELVNGEPNFRIRAAWALTVKEG